MNIIHDISIQLNFVRVISLRDEFARLVAKDAVSHGEGGSAAKPRQQPKMRSGEPNEIRCIHRSILELCWD